MFVIVIQHKFNFHAVDTARKMYILITCVKTGVFVVFFLIGWTVAIE